MSQWLKQIRDLFYKPEQRGLDEVDRIRQLKQAAQDRRQEFAARRAREEEIGVPPSPSVLATEKQAVEEAENAYALALQAWDNRQWRLRGR